MARKASPRLDPEQQAQRKRRRYWLGCLGAFGLLLLVIVLAALVNYVRATSGPALPREILQRDTARGGGAAPAPAGATAPVPGTPAASPANVPPLKDQLQRLQSASSSGSSSPQTIYVTDAELTAAVARSAERGGQLRDVRAYFGAGKAFVVAVARWRGRDLNLTVTTAPVLVNGGMQFGVESVKIGSVSAPEAVRERIQSEFNKHGDGLTPARTGLYIESYEIREGMAVLTGRAVSRGQ